MKEANLTEQGIFRLRSLLAALAACIIIALSAPGEARAAVRGIDVSSWQGTIDWNAVKNSGVSFVMVRLGNSHYGIDEKSVANAVGAAASGLRVGAYVYTYATNVQEAAQDAQLAVALMSNLPISFPVAIDIEDSVHKKMSSAELMNIVNTFCSIVYQAGYTPMVYSNKSFLTDKLPGVPWDVWVAQYNDHCDYIYPYAMWQASQSGSIAGISGNVDIDYLFKDYFTQIVPEGLVHLAGNTYYYHNFRRMFGFQTVGAAVYLFDATGAMVKDQTITDAQGNITRMCKDGHVVQITAAMQAAAAQAQQAYAQAQMLAAATEAALLQNQQAETAAQAQYLALKDQADTLALAAGTALLQAQALPTPELVEAATAAQQAADLAASSAAEALTIYAQAQQTTAQTQLTLTAQKAAAEQAGLTAAAAMAAVQIPD